MRSFVASIRTSRERLCGTRPWIRASEARGTEPNRVIRSLLLAYFPRQPVRTMHTTEQTEARLLDANNAEGEPCARVDTGQAPVRVHGVGVYYRRFFDLDVDYFN